MVCNSTAAALIAAPKSDFSPLMSLMRWRDPILRRDFAPKSKKLSVNSAIAWSGKVDTCFPERSCSNKKLNRNDDPTQNLFALALGSGQANHRRYAGVGSAFAHVTLFLDDIQIAKIAEFALEHRPRVQVLHAFGPAGAIL